MNNNFSNPLTVKITAFLQEIGLPVKASSIDEPTVLPGIHISGGAIIIDESKLKYPGDLLHEAGHLAVIAPAKRTLDNCVGKKAHEEIAAIAWSYAALVHLELEPSTYGSSKSHFSGFHFTKCSES